MPRAPGQALADFHIFRLVAEAWGCGEMFRDWKTPEAVFQILKRLRAASPATSPASPTTRMLDERGGMQWPLPEGAPPPESERRLFADGAISPPTAGRSSSSTSRGRCRSRPSASLPVAAAHRARQLDQWHTQTRTKVGRAAQALAERSLRRDIPADARSLGIEPDERVNVSSQRGAMVARAFVSNTVKPGQVFIPMHYEAMNQLTFAAFDPYSRQPAYKACAVRVSKLDPSLTPG